VAAVQRRDELAEDAPHKALLRVHAAVGQVLDDAAQVAVAAVLHVEVQVLALLEVFAVVVGYNVGMPQVRQDLELGVQLLALLLRHAQVADLLAAHDEAVRLAPHLADDAKGAMACGERASVLARECVSERVVVGIVCVRAGEGEVEGLEGTHQSSLMYRSCLIPTWCPVVLPRRLGGSRCGI
jgi:high-affinity nickel permease